MCERRFSKHIRYNNASESNIFMWGDISVELSGSLSDCYLTEAFTMSLQALLLHWTQFCYLFQLYMPLKNVLHSKSFVILDCTYTFGATSFLSPPFLIGHRICHLIWVKKKKLTDNICSLNKNGGGNTDCLLLWSVSRVQKVWECKDMRTPCPSDS